MISKKNGFINNNPINLFEPIIHLTKYLPFSFNPATNSNLFIENPFTEFCYYIV